MKEKHLFYLGIGALSIFFLWLFDSTFYFSSDYNWLSFRDIDDIIFHQDLYQMKTFADSGQWAEFLSENRHAYGSIYWIFVYVLTLPATLLGYEQLSILIPRNISLVAYIFCFVGVYKIARAQGVSRFQSLLPLFLLATCAASYDASTRFHNHTIIAALMIWSFYYLLRPDAQKFLGRASFLFGLSLGVKIVSVVMSPVFILLFNAVVVSSSSQRDYREIAKINLKYFALMAVTALISFCPGVLYIFLGEIDHFYKSLSFMKWFLFGRYNPNQDIGLLKHFGENFFLIYFHPVTCVLFFILGLSIYSDRKKWNWENLRWPILGGLGFFCAVVTLLLNRHQPFLMRHYNLAPAILMTFICMGVLIERRRRAYLLIPIALINWGINYPSVESYSWRSKLVKIKADFEVKKARYASYAEKNLIAASDRVKIDSQIIFPLDLPNKIQEVEFTFSRDLNAYNADVYIFNKQRDDFKKTCKELANEGVNFDNCNAVQKIMEGVSPWAIVFEDDYIRVVRKTQPKAQNLDHFLPGLSVLRADR